MSSEKDEEEKKGQLHQIKVQMTDLPKSIFDKSESAYTMPNDSSAEEDPPNKMDAAKSARNNSVMGHSYTSKQSVKTTSVKNPARLLSSKDDSKKLERVEMMISSQAFTYTD